MKPEKKYLPFGYKLMLTYSAFVLVPLLLIGYIASSVFVGSIREQTRTNIQGTLKQMKANIDYKLDEIHRISDLLYNDDMVATNLRNYDAGWLNYEATKKYLLPKFRTAIETTRNKAWLSFYLRNESISEIYSVYGDQDPLAVKNRIFDWYHIERIEDKPWYRQFPEEQYGATYQWKKVEDDEKFGRISLLRRLVDISQVKLKEIGFLRISVYLSEMFESADYRKISDGTAILIVDENRRVVVSSGSPEWKSGQLWSDADQNGPLVIQESLTDLNWKLIALVPTELIERDAGKLRTLTMFVCAGCVLVFTVAGFLISRFFSKRVTKIVSVLDSFQEGEFHKRIAFKGNDEFTRISGALNDMGQNIGSLIREVYVTNLQKKEAELASLQAQINPHFLYNTLSSISRLANFGEVQKLQKMVLDLAKFYRLSLNDGKNLISIYDEVEQVKSYVAIQQTKFGDRMRVTYDIRADVIGYETLKLVLQPFVENALEHAWCGDRIHIRIAGELSKGLIVFSVIDDGVGFHPDTLKRVLSTQVEDIQDIQVGYGIRNVDQRIKLHYGKAYGVTIASRPGIGSAIQIVFPAQTNRNRNEAKS